MCVYIYIYAYIYNIPSDDTEFACIQCIQAQTSSKDTNVELLL